MTTQEACPVTIDRSEAFAQMCGALTISQELIRAYDFHPAQEEQGEFPDDLMQNNTYCKYDRSKYCFLTTIVREQARAHLDEAGFDAERFTGGALEGGMIALGMFLQQGVNAYERFCAQTGSQPSVEQLSAIFHRSFSTLTPFARMDNRTNKHLEAIYQLRGTTSMPDMLGTRNFEVSQETGAPKLVAIDWDESVQRVEEVYLHPACNPRICAAYEKFLPAAYHWAIDFAAATHEFFPSDIARIMGSDEQ